jgi:hypothetical protein
MGLCSSIFHSESHGFLESVTFIYGLFHINFILVIKSIIDIPEVSYYLVYF